MGSSDTIDLSFLHSRRRVRADDGASFVGDAMLGIDESKNA
jgi:hypothetical protein